jgi:hypothetical protein
MPGATSAIPTPPVVLSRAEDHCFGRRTHSPADDSIACTARSRAASRGLTERVASA